MRKLHQNQILDLLKTLDKVIDEIKRLLKNNLIPAAINLLADCQDSAINACGFIREMHSEGTKTGGLLIEFSELLYKASTEINNEKNPNKFADKFKDKLRIIKNSVNNELKPNKIEIAFFPYKASMWDCLESIYLAAKDDPACDAYVVPIPYYDRLPGGAFGQMHYEGREYPSDIPVVDWQAYNVEERKPDVIFVHNPYDDSNYVTSIHPNFYCKRLKNLTDCLVYVPYFVCAGDEVQEHFCALPGTIYAHKVIVQSEGIRQSYIKHFRQFEKNNNCRAVFGKPEDKFVALGSPKFDKAINSKPENFALPSEWQRLIMKPDGTKKKVFFYNTTIGAILEGNEKYLQKIRHVLDVFRGAQDVVLLWRPHPLNEATFQSMRPRLLVEYEQIIADYKREGWGIFDSSSDLHRAIAWSDVYYGDVSSVIAMFDAVGKPVVVQNVEVREGFGNKAFFWWIVADGNDIWFCAARFNALFKMSKETWEPEYIGSFPSLHEHSIYTVRILHNENLYCISANIGEFAEYDIQKNTMSLIKYERAEYNKNDTYDFRTAINYDKYLFFMPHSYKAIMRFNAETKEFVFFDDWLEPLSRLITDEKDPFFNTPLRITENTIMLSSYRANAVVEFNMETLKSKVYEVGQKGDLYNNICFDGKDYWLSLWNRNSIIKWNPDIGVIKEFTNIAEGSFYENRCCFSAIFCEGYVWLIPHYSKQVFKINVKTDEVSKVEGLEPNFIEGESRIHPAAYFSAQNIGNIIYAYTGRDGTFIEYDCKTQKKREKIIKYSPSVMEKIKPLRQKFFLYKDMAKCQKVTDCYYYEQPMFALSDYINCEINDCNSIKKQLFSKMNSNADGTAGKMIFDFLKRNVHCY